MPGLDDSNPGAAENGLQLSRKKAATGAAGAVTLNAPAGMVTTEALATAAGATQSYAITNNKVNANSIVLMNVANGTNSAGRPTVCEVTPGAGVINVVLQNIHASAALNGSLKLQFALV